MDEKILEVLFDIKKYLCLVHDELCEVKDECKRIHRELSEINGTDKNSLSGIVNNLEDIQSYVKLIWNKRV